MLSIYLQQHFHRDVVVAPKVQRWKSSTNSNRCDALLWAHRRYFGSTAAWIKHHHSTLCSAATPTVSKRARRGHSVPINEYNEVLAKSAILRRALELAREGPMSAPRLLLIDNYDSFPLYPWCRHSCVGRRCVASQRSNHADQRVRQPSHLCISPGPGPLRCRNLDEMIEAFAATADFRRVPRPSIHYRSVRRQSRTRAASNAWQNVDGDARRQRRICERVESRGSGSLSLTDRAA